MLISGMEERESVEREGKKKMQKEKQKTEYEFCKACNINHDQGLCHKYFPNHKKSHSSFLSRFRKKLFDIRFFLNALIPLDPQLVFSQSLMMCLLQPRHPRTFQFLCLFL
ncbi:hypothetical protein VIGAN_02238400 [Vigna angularis var. angularis]|uniref:Uncharacterized protein n=1 Tax=Vigna angularis var. angularis TaxID=157739 RepID=A0A0S3RG27_PHAAN|nr:hypothetical protein VIGAN_02238400 [Vigna angularis var. angularis]